MGRWSLAGDRRWSGMATKKKKERDLERMYPRAQFVAKLRRLADAIETKRPFTIQVAGERLYVSANAIFNIEHERESGEEELEFQLRWSSGGTGK